MPLEPPDLQHWQGAVGYVELQMFEDADDEVEKIDPLARASPEVLAVRIAVYHGLQKWELMREIARRLVDFNQTMSNGQFHCLRDQTSRFDSSSQRDLVECRVEIPRKRGLLNTISLAIAASFKTSKMAEITWRKLLRLIQIGEKQHWTTQI